MSPCPSEAQLRGFLDKRLDDDQSAALETHVEECHQPRKFRAVFS